MGVPQESNKKQRIGKILSLLFFLVLVGLAIFLLPWEKTWQTLRIANIGLIILSLLLSIPSQLISTYAYKLVLDGQKAPISYWRLLFINMAMNFYDIILPSTFVVSGMRWYRYSKQSQKTAQSFVSIAYYKVFNIILSLILSVTFLTFSDATTMQGHIGQLIVILVSVISIMLVTPWFSRWLIQQLPVPSSELQSRNLTHKVLVYVYKIIQAFAEFEKLKFTAQLAIVALGVINQLIIYLSYLLIARSVEVNLTYAQLGTLRAILLLVVNLPINFGVIINLRDVTLLAILATMGIAMDKAVAISVLSFGRVLFVGVLGGIVELLNILFGKMRT